MSRREIIAGLDIGTSEVKIVIGEIDPKTNQINIIGYAQAASSGVDKSDIIDIDNVALTIKEVAEYAERMAGVAVDGFFVGLPVQHITLIHNSGAVAVGGNDRIVQEEDVERVLHAAQIVALPPEKRIIDIIPCQFRIDNKTGIQRPVGMAGVRLEVDAMLIAIDRSVEQNIRRCVEEAGYEIFQFVLNPLASASVVLQDDEKEVGVILLDIGGGTTELSYFNKGVLLDTVSIPIGGKHITADLASILKIPQRQAEEIKCHYADLMNLRDQEYHVNTEYGELGFERYNAIDPELVHDIISSRVEELMDLIVDEIVRIGFKEPPAAGIKVIGGVSKTPGFKEFASECLFTKVRYGFEDEDDQSFVIAKGIVNFVYHHNFNYVEYDARERQGAKAITGIWRWIKDLFEME